MSAIIKTDSVYSNEILEKVILKNDLSGLSSVERVMHVKNMCESLGLNPLTQPIKLLEFQGKVIPYMAKDGTEQLRKLHNVSVTEIETKTIDQGIYIATAHASMPNGRTDASTGAVSISNLKGDALCNAIMKAETKAKRRATLSICGLGILDETEIETMKGARRFDYTANPEIRQDKKIERSYDIEPLVTEINVAENVEHLEEVFKRHYRTLVANRDMEGLKQIVEAKDAKKKLFDPSIDKFIAEMDEDIPQ